MAENNFTNSRWKRRLLRFSLVLILLHILVEISGHHYLYTTLGMTVFKGKLGPEIEEYKDMVNDSVMSWSPEPWKVASAFGSHSFTDEEEAYHQRFQSTAFLVIHRDQVLFEKYWEHFDGTTPSNSFSMAKSIVSVLTGIALKRGELDSLKMPLYRLLPRYDKGFGKQVTIRDMLTMSSGIDFDEHYLNPFAFPAKANYGDNLELLVSQYDVSSAPGIYYDYQSGTTQVLGFALQAATRRSMTAYATDHLWSKIGAEHPALWSKDHEDGIEKAFCCFNAVARDFARLGKLYMQHGQWGGEQIVDSAYVAASVHPPGTIMSDGSPCEIYGYSWWLGKHKGHEFYFMRGIKGQYVIAIPDLDLIVTRLGRLRDKGSNNPHPDDVFNYINMALRMIEE